MATITIEITDTELKCMEYCALSPQDWIRNATVARAKVASDEIIAILVNYCNNNEIALAVGKDAQIQQAYDLGIIKTAADANAEFLANLVNENNN